MTNPLLRTPTVAPRERRNRYERIGFRGNPFPAEPGIVPGSPDPRLNGSIYSEQLHKDKQTVFDRLLIPAHDRPEPRSLVFLMDHASRRGRGIGKTAFLRHQQEVIMQDLGQEASDGTEVIFAAHVIPTTSPSCRKFWEFCRAVSHALCQQKAIAQAVWRLRALSGKISDQVLDGIGSAGDWEATIGDNSWLASQGVNVLFDLIPAVRRTLLENGIPDDLAHALANHGASPNAFSAEVLARYSDYQWRRIGGSFLFQDLVHLFLAARFTRGLLLIDEVEKMVYHQNAQERRAFVESLRYYVFDGDCENARRRMYGMLLTIHPGIQETLLSHWQAAGLDRLAPLAEPDAQRCTIYFPPLDKALALPLVNVYLNYYRTDDAKRGQIHPFTEDAIAEALLKSGGVPGRTLSLLHRVVEKAVEEESDTIDRESVERAYAASERVEAGELSESGKLPPSRVDLTGERGRT